MVFYLQRIAQAEIILIYISFFSNLNWRLLCEHHKKTKKIKPVKFWSRLLLSYVYYARSIILPQSRYFDSKYQHSASFKIKNSPHASTSVLISDHSTRAQNHWIIIIRKEYIFNSICIFLWFWCVNKRLSVQVYFGIFNGLPGDRICWWFWHHLFIIRKKSEIHQHEKPLFNSTVLIGRYSFNRILFLHLAVVPISSSLFYKSL